MSLTPEREAQIRALPVKTEPERDLLEALDEARALLMLASENVVEESDETVLVEYGRDVQRDIEDHFKGEGRDPLNDLRVELAEVEQERDRLRGKLETVRPIAERMFANATDGDDIDPDDAAFVAETLSPDAPASPADEAGEEA